MDMRSLPGGQNPGTNFIPNPLPVPKRHTPREMDYDHDVLPDKMHYDVQTGDADDFDI